LLKVREEGGPGRGFGVLCTTAPRPTDRPGIDREGQKKKKK